jgi:hypothetical protein
MEKQFFDALEKEIQNVDQPDGVRDAVDKLLNETDYLSNLDENGIDATVEDVITKALDQLYNTKPFPEEVDQYYEDFFAYAQTRIDVSEEIIRARVKKLISDGTVCYGRILDEIFSLTQQKHSEKWIAIIILLFYLIT